MPKKDVCGFNWGSGSEVRCAQIQKVLNRINMIVN